MQKASLVCSWKIFFLSRIPSCKMAPTCRLRASTWPILDPALCSTTNSIFSYLFLLNYLVYPVINFDSEPPFSFSRGLDWYVCGRALFLFKFHFSHYLLTASGAWVTFSLALTCRFAVGNYPTVGAVCKLFLRLASLLFTRLRAVSLLT